MDVRCPHCYVGFYLPKPCGMSDTLIGSLQGSDFGNGSQSHLAQRPYHRTQLESQRNPAQSCPPELQPPDGCRAQDLVPPAILVARETVTAVVKEGSKYCALTEHKSLIIQGGCFCDNNEREFGE